MLAGAATVGQVPAQLPPSASDHQHDVRSAPDGQTAPAQQDDLDLGQHTPRHRVSPDVPIVQEPAAGVPAVIASPAEFAHACVALLQGSGPIAIDVERASGFRYSNRAYLIQIQRTGSGTFLFDPLAWDLSHPHYGGIDAEPLREILRTGAAGEWIVHAASQDLPSLVGENLLPTAIFDTELAGRLLGYPRVALSVMTEQVLGLGLEKGFSAVDWSRRPLPEPWLRYAALDVELLVQLREGMQQLLEQAGKWQWAQEEFAWLVHQANAMATESPGADGGQRSDAGNEAADDVEMGAAEGTVKSQTDQSWRRTNGIHRIRQPRDLALVRALWQRRDQIARDTDTAASRLLPDAVIIEVAQKKPSTRGALHALPSMEKSKGPTRYLKDWLQAITDALALPPSDWPQPQGVQQGLPPVRAWRERKPQAAARLAAAREALAALSQQHSVPAENLLPPQVLRQACWHEPPFASPAQLEQALAGWSARPWQVQLCAPALWDSMTCAQQ